MPLEFTESEYKLLSKILDHYAMHCEATDYTDEFIDLQAKLNHYISE